MRPGRDEFAEAAAGNPVLLSYRYGLTEADEDLEQSTDAARKAAAPVLARQVDIERLQTGFRVAG